jgi:DNA mismatch repair ATPase MutL
LSLRAEGEAIPNGKSTLVDIFGKELESQLLSLGLERGEIKISGFISSTTYYRSDRRGIFTLLNNRVIRCPVLRSSVDAVYKQYHQPGRHPIVLLRVDMPAADVDVNVHPNKREVKYKNSNAVYTAVGDAIAKALADASYATAGTKQINFASHELQLVEQGALSLAHPKLQCHPERSEGPLNHSIEILRDAQNDITVSARNDRPERAFSTLSAPQDFETYSEPRTTSPSRSFISRLGAVDISIVDTINHKTLVSTQGNKTTFEIVATANSKTVICRGDFVGENWLKDKYLKFVYERAYEVLESEANKTGTATNRSRPARNPAKSVLEQLWARDNYTCIYCRKILLHPNTASKAKSECTDPSAFRKYINAQGEELTVNVFDEHTATYDHVLPASKYAELNIDDRNLITACIECNKQKSDSLATNTWLEKAAANQDYNAWAGISEKNPLVIAGIKFTQALTITNNI